MTMPTTHALAASTGTSAPFGGHLWHTIEAAVFLVVSLGGIACAEYVQARRRRHEIEAAPAARQRVAATVGGGPSSVALLPERPAAVPAIEPSARRAMLLPIVALAGAAAAAVHFVVMPEHFEESALYGTFFAVAATSQILYSALLLIRPSRPLIAAGALGNAAIIVLWVITRTLGIPLGPASGSVEEIGGLDVLATVFEVVTAAGAIMLLRRPRITPAAKPWQWAPIVWALSVGATAAIAVTAYLYPPS